jgi:hypothetical protein
MLKVAILIGLGAMWLGVVVPPAGAAEGAGWLRPLVPSGESALATVMDGDALYATRIDGTGGVGPLSLIATGAQSDPPNGGAPTIPGAYSKERSRFLVLWSGWEPGMATATWCFENPFPATPPECQQVRDQEIFVRVVAADGSPVGPARRVSTTGSADSITSWASYPSAIWDAASNRWLVAYSANDADARTTRMLIQALEPDGAPFGPPVALDDQAPPVELFFSGHLVERPGPGASIFFMWGQRYKERELFVAPVDANANAGARVQVSPVGLPGVSGPQFAPAGRNVLALWAEDRSGRPHPWRARRLSKSGLPRGPLLDLSSRFGRDGLAVTGARARGWLYSVERNGTTYFLRSDKFGRPTGRMTSTGVAAFAALHQARRRVIAAWSTLDGGTSRWFIRRVP